MLPDALSMVAEANENIYAVLKGGDGMIRIKVRGTTRRTESFLRRTHRISRRSLDYYGQKGVEALQSATPVKTGLTAASWSYEIVENKDNIAIVWKNSNFVKGYPVAMLLQYGHGTKNGGYVQGIDYINPALEPIFNQMAKTAWAEVTR